MGRGLAAEGCNGTGFAVPASLGGELRDETFTNRARRTIEGTRDRPE